MSINISVVIPIYNERENLTLLDEKITKSITPLNKKYEVILVDDGSVDGSAQLIRKLKNGNPSPYRKTYRKNPRMEKGINGKGKLTGKKMYDPFTRKHEIFTEKKLPKSK